MPALYNLKCDGLLPERFAIVGLAMEELTTEVFRERLSGCIQTFNTRKEFDPKIWSDLRARLHYLPGRFDDDSAFKRLHAEVARLDAQYQAGHHGQFHWHPEVTEFEYLLEGSLAYREADTGNITVFQAGDLATVPAGVCVERIIQQPCRTLAIKVPSNDVKIHCRDCARMCTQRVEPFKEIA